MRFFIINPSKEKKCLVHTVKNDGKCRLNHSQHWKRRTLLLVASCLLVEDSLSTHTLSLSLSVRATVSGDWQMDNEALQAALASAGLVGVVPVVSPLPESSPDDNGLADERVTDTAMGSEQPVVADYSDRQQGANQEKQSTEEEMLSLTPEENTIIQISVKYMYFNMADENSAEGFTEPTLIDLKSAATVTFDDLKMTLARFKVLAEREYTQMYSSRQTEGEEGQEFELIDMNNDVAQTFVRTVEGYDLPDDVYVQELGEDTLHFVMGVLRNPEPLGRKKKMSKQAPAKDECAKYKEVHQSLKKRAEETLFRSSLELENKDTIKIAENVYYEYTKLRQEGGKTVEQALEAMGARVQIKGVRTDEHVKKLISDKLVRSIAVINSRLHMTREIECIETGVNENIEINRCKTMADMLQHYASNRHRYDPHDVFGKLIETFMPGTQITLASQNIKEEYAMHIRDIETAIFMCVLVEYGVIESFELLEQFLL